MYQLYFNWNHRCFRAMPSPKEKLLTHVWLWLLQRCGISSSAHLTLNGDRQGSQRDASKVLGLLVAWPPKERQKWSSVSQISHIFSRRPNIWAPPDFVKMLFSSKNISWERIFAAILKEIDDDDKDNLMWCIILKFRCKYFWSQFPILPQLSFGTDGKIQHEVLLTQQTKGKQKRLHSFFSSILPFKKKTVMISLLAHWEQNYCGSCIFFLVVQMAKGSSGLFQNCFDHLLGLDRWRSSSVELPVRL